MAPLIRHYSGARLRMNLIKDSSQRVRNVTCLRTTEGIRSADRLKISDDAAATSSPLRAQVVRFSSIAPYGLNLHLPPREVIEYERAHYICSLNQAWLPTSSQDSLKAAFQWAIIYRLAGAEVQIVERRGHVWTRMGVNLKNNPTWFITDTTGRNLENQGFTFVDLQSERHLVQSHPHYALAHLLPWETAMIQRHVPPYQPHITDLASLQRNFGAWYPARLASHSNTAVHLYHESLFPITPKPERSLSQAISTLPLELARRLLEFMRPHLSSRWGDCDKSAKLSGLAFRLAGAEVELIQYGDYHAHWWLRANIIDHSQPRWFIIDLVGGDAPQGHPLYGRFQFVHLLPEKDLVSQHPSYEASPRYFTSIEKIFPPIEPYLRREISYEEMIAQITAKGIDLPPILQTRSWLADLGFSSI